MGCQGKAGARREAHGRRGESRRTRRGRAGPHLPERQAQWRGARGCECQSADGRRQCRTGQRAGAKDSRKRLVPEPGRDGGPLEVEDRELQHEARHAGTAAIVDQGEGGQGQAAIGRRLGLDCVEADSRSHGARAERGHRRRDIGLLRGGEDGRHQREQRQCSDSHPTIEVTGHCLVIRLIRTYRSYRSSTSSHHRGKGGETHRPIMVAVRI